MIKDYKNSNEILKTSGPIDGEWLTTEDSQLLNLQFETKNVKFGTSKTDSVELHVYDLNGNLLASNHNVDGWKTTKPEEQPSTPEPRIFLDPHNNLRNLGFNRGEYKFVYNFLRPLLGEYNSNRQLFLKEIKSNKTELVLATNIVDSSSEALNQEYLKVKSQIDKFFEIQNRESDLEANMDSTQLPTITKENNKPIWEKFQKIRNIIDSNVLKNNLNRKSYITSLVKETAKRRKNTFSYSFVDDLKKIKTDTELFYYYIHTLPNDKFSDFRDEIYYINNPKGDSNQLPVGINNLEDSKHPDYTAIKTANAKTRAYINRLLSDPSYAVLTQKDKDEIKSIITTRNTNLQQATDNRYVNIQSLIARDQYLPDGVLPQFLLNSEAVFSVTIDNAIANYKKLKIDADTELVKIGNEEENIDGEVERPSQYVQLVKELKKKISNADIVLQELNVVKEVFKTRKLTVTEQEVDAILDDARDYIAAEIESNSVTLTNKDFEYVVQPYDDYYEFFDLNFGNNVLLKITNIVRLSDNEIGIKLYEPIPKSISEKQTCWVTKYIRKPYIDNIIVLPEPDAGLNNTLRAPNFHIETYDLDSKETEFQNWNELLGTNANTSQQIIDSYFSGSIGDVKLNINYCEFDNFVHFSSAEERVKNFKYKLELIEFYDGRLTTLTNAAKSGSVSNNITDTLKKRRAVISGFDDFEKFLYFESGSQVLYTPDSCSIKPWPKEDFQTVTRNLTWIEAFQAWVSASYTWTEATTSYSQSAFRPYVNKRTTNPSSITYYGQLLQLAQDYDRANPYSLPKTIPDHVREDAQNEDYELFVNMMGQHFDIMWTYINHLTKINTREEHPKDGISDDLIYDVAKSMGWHLANGNYDAKLWDYALGQNEDGTVKVSGSFMPTKSKDAITKEIWRRQLNNLPYFLKTKGTERSVRALVACYGVPQTILTVREYGGPSKSGKRPTYNKHQFDYAVNIADNRHIQTEWAPLHYTGSTYRYPDTITIRFRPYDVNGKSTLLQVGTGSATTMRVELEPTGSATEAGNIHFYLSGSNGYLTASILDECIYDNDFTSLMIRRKTSTDVTSTNNYYDFFVKKHKWGKLTINASASINATASLSSSYNGSWTTSGSMYVGAYFTDDPSGTTYYTGSVQELRYWTVPLSESIFDNHVTSVGSYNSNNVTGSFYDLQFRINLIDKIDLTQRTYISSSHPDQTQKTFENGNALVATFEGTWPNVSASWYAFEEKQYIEGPSLGGNNLYSDKIRIENNSLRGNLSTRARQEVSAFDSAPLDSKRLGVYFSPQSVINDDIFRHLGFFELDDYIGSAADLYKETYPELKDIAEEYWKKYSNKNDIAAYIRLFSLFDFTMFQQIKQLLPGRTNAVTGLVIEPNVLERNKIKAVKPSKAELDHSVELDRVYPEMTGEETTHESVIDIEWQEITADENSYSAVVADTDIVKLDAQEDSIADVNNTDYDYHNVKGDLDIKTDEVLETSFPANNTWVTQSANFVTKNYEVPTTYCHSYLLVDKTKPYYGLERQTTTNFMNVVSQSSGIGQTWTNLSNFNNSTSSNAYVNLTSNQSSERIVLSNFNFTSSNIANDARINGIELTIFRKQRLLSGIGGKIYDGEIYITKTGPTGSATPIGDNKATGSAWPTIAAYKTYGGSSDDWNAGLTGGDLKSGSFGIILQAKHQKDAVNSTRQASVYTADLKIYYSNPTIFTTGSSAPELCQPTESYIGNPHVNYNPQLSGYWVHQETGWLSPTSASSFSSSAVNWNIPSGTLFPSTASGTNQVTFTAVYSGFNPGIGTKAIGFKDPYNFVYRGIATRLTRYADNNSATNYAFDKTITIGTDLTAHTGTNLSGSISGITSVSESAATPGTAATTGSATVQDWSNPENALTAGLYAVASSPGPISETTQYLATGNYGFNIPSSSIINGIQVTLNRFGQWAGSATAIVSGSTITLTKTSGSGDILVGNPSASTDIWLSVPYPTEPAAVTETFGGPNDLWGTTWTPNEINSSGFGAFFTCYLEADFLEVTFANVGSFTVEVFFTQTDAKGWSTTSQRVTYGNNSQKWGQVFTADDLNSEEFNFKVQAEIAGSTVARIDDVKMKMFYSYYVTGSDRLIQEDIPLGIQNHRYNGCKITSPDINEPSQDTFDKGPVVEVTTANPNALILKRNNGTDGVFEIGKSPINVRD